MAVPTYNFTWEQGTDLIISMTYKEGPLDAETPVNLSAYSLRMDIAAANVRLYTFNSADVTDLNADGTAAGGADEDTTKEATLGSDGSITIVIPRSLTLPGGVVYTKMAGATPITIFDYDIVLRTSAGKQSKILSGKITVNRSVTLWV